MFFKTYSYIKVFFHITEIIITTLGPSKEVKQSLIAYPEGLKYTFYSKETSRDIEVKSNKLMDFHLVYTVVVQLSLLRLHLSIEEIY